MLAKVVIVLGVLGVLLGFGVAVVSALLPELTSGRVNWEEAALGIIPGVLVLLVSFFILVIGVVLLVVGKRKKQP